MAGDSEGNDNSREAAPRNDAVQESPAQREVNDAQQSGQAETGKDRAEQSRAETANLQNQGALPDFDLSDDSKQKNPSNSAEKPEPTGLSGSSANPKRDCTEADPTVADGYKIPTLDVEKAGLPPEESRGSLSAVPVENGDKPGERTLATTAHGMVKLPGHNSEGNKYQLLDSGFKQTDTNNDGNLDRKELDARVKEGKADSENPAGASLAYQAQYALNNYDGIAAKSKELDPKATGITNEGLAQHYLDNAKVTVRTASGESFPAKVVSGDRNTDAAVVKATGLNEKQNEAIGPNFKMSDTDPKKGDLVNTVGHASGTQGAESRCFVPTQAGGVVKGEGTSLIPGKSDSVGVSMFSGMSGGPVVDQQQQNKVMGLNHASNDRRGYFIPASAVNDELRKARK